MPTRATAPDNAHGLLPHALPLSPMNKHYSLSPQPGRKILDDIALDQCRVWRGAVFSIAGPAPVGDDTGSALPGVIAATLWFGLAHYYQGRVGIVITFMPGAILMFIYLYTGRIWLAMLIHAILDLNDLSFPPGWQTGLPAAGPGQTVSDNRDLPAASQ